jgi:hypothetical protein
MMTSGRGRLALAVLLTMTACRGGCRRASEGEPAADPALALFPAEATVVVSVDFRRVRETGLWKQLAQLAGEDPQDGKVITGMVAATGFDPFRQVNRIVAAFPEEARSSGAFGIVIETDPGAKIDRPRLLAYLQAEARRRGDELITRQRRGRTFWTGATAAGGDAGAGDAGADADPLGRGAAGFFLDDHHFVLGAGGWAQRMADIADRATPTPARLVDQPVLNRLVGRISGGRSIWMAALVPEATRARLMANPRFGADAAVMRFGANVDLGPALAAELVAELSNQADAAQLISKVDKYLVAAKKSPEVLLLGVAPYLDGVKTEVEGPNARIRVQLPAAQTEELVGRLVGLLRLRRGGRAPLP